MAAEISASETEKSLEFSPKILRVFSLPLWEISERGHFVWFPGFNGLGGQNSADREWPDTTRELCETRTAVAMRSVPKRGSVGSTVHYTQAIMGIVDPTLYMKGRPSGGSLELF